jgi:hypothetical protein
LSLISVSGQCQVLGLGGVEVIPGHKGRTGGGKVYESRQSFALSEIGEYRIPKPIEDLPQEVWQQALEARSQPFEEIGIDLPTEVSELVIKREAARSKKDWKIADDLRVEINKLGWQVKDTPQGPVIEKDGE